jgi:hypothetical protein
LAALEQLSFGDLSPVPPWVKSPPTRIARRAAKQSYEAIEKWYAVVYLTLVYLYWRRCEEGEAHGHTPSLSEVVTGIRRDHQREVLRAACEEVAAGTPVEAVLERYLGGARPQAA